MSKKAMLQRPVKILLFSLMMIVLIPSKGRPCTAFSLVQKDRLVLGKNYDWHLERGLVLVNKMGVSKKAMAGEQYDHPGEYPEWTSKYGSLTFNQYGREMPIGGMNEAGLVVEVLMLTATRYPEPDSRSPIKELQWVQFQLDNFSSVEEVIRSDSYLRILPYEEPGLHYLVSDRSGNCAAIEFLGGKLVCHTGETMAVRALANNTYEGSLAFLRRKMFSEGKISIGHDMSSLERFCVAARMLEDNKTSAPARLVDRSFDILEAVSQSSTQWSIVYDQTNLRVYFKTATHKKIRYIDLEDLDFSCKTPVKYLHLTEDLSGDIAHCFKDYSQQVNLDLLRYTFKETSFINSMPDAFIRRCAEYPETTLCVE